MFKTTLLKDEAAADLSQREKILYCTLGIFFFSLYMPGVTWLYNAAMWLVVGYALIFNKIREKLFLLRQRKALYFIALFFILSSISAALSANKHDALAAMGYRLTLLALPLALGTVYIRPLLKERIVAAFAYATTFGALLCLLYGLWQAQKYHDASLLYNDNLSNIINFQSIYFAMLVNLAIFSYTWLYLNKPQLLNVNLIVPALLVLLVVNFLLASRMAIIILYSSVVFFAFFQIIKKKKILEGVTLVMGLILGCFLLVKFFPKTINRFKELTYTKFNYQSNAKESHFNVQLTADQWNGANIRIAVWNCTWQVIEKNMLTGTGIGDKMAELKKQYAKNKFYFGVNTDRNVHNNYLDIWLSMGLAGILVFVTGFFIFPLIGCIKSGDWYGAILTGSIMLCLVSETYTDRMIGNTLIAYVAAFVIACYKPKAVDNATNYLSGTGQ